MTQKAIDLLDAASRPTAKGFFLQVEGASIDKQDHAANPCAQIGETVAFDNSIKIAQDYAATHPDTLIIMTTDHGHTSQIISNSAAATSPGATATLTTADNAQMTINYGTAPVTGSQEHTGTQARIAAAGPYAANVTGLTDQTDLNGTVIDALRLVRDLPATPTDTTAADLAAAVTTTANLVALVPTLAPSNAINLNQKISSTPAWASGPGASRRPAPRTPRGRPRRPRRLRRRRRLRCRWPGTMPRMSPAT